MNAPLVRFALAIGLLASLRAFAADSVVEVRLDQMVTVTATGDDQLPFKFNADRPFVISLNLSIPGYDAFKGNLVANLTAGDLAGKVVFDLFASEKPPQFVEVILGRRVPVAIAQAVIKAVGAIPGLKMTLVLETEDNQFGGTQRIYVGSLTQKPRTPVSAEKLRSLLAPQHSPEEFHALVVKDS